MKRTDKVTIELETKGDPLVSRVFAILKDRIQERCPAEVVAAGSDAMVILTVDGSLPTDAFRIDQVRGAVRITGGLPRGLLYGAGKFLRTSRYDGAFRPSEWRGTSAPTGSLRGMYFASHFHNWYHQASEPEIIRYVEDIALWGMNAIMVAFPIINLNGWDDPEAKPAMEFVRQYARAAKKLGLMFATGANNVMFKDSPAHLLATPLPDPLHRRGNHGRPVCPGNPAGHAYIMSNVRRIFEELSDVGLDLLCLWPYDEGGCACEKCLPWGSNGYLKLSRDMTNLGRQYFPNLKTILSTWMFDTPPEGEWQGLADSMNRENGWVDYVLADSHEDFPRYPLDAGVPGNLPLINFPEISMWGNWPWGGAGAHPMPARFQRLWNQVKHAVSGGFPYSEGIYEDMTKAVVVQFYWDRDRQARATLEEYIAYEFGAAVVDEVLAIVNLLESSATRAGMRQPVVAEEVHRAYQLAEAVNTRLPDWARHSWRWEILHLRAVIDRERYAGGGLETPAAEAAMKRLIEIYHCQMVSDDQYHHRVRPPLRTAITRCPEC